MSDLAKSEYVERVNRAIDYVLENPGQPVRLEEAARAAAFSPFHFHRIFRGLMGETLASFVKRVRLERAARLIAHHPRANLTEIALECGFSSSSDFSRSFRKHYGVSPSKFAVDETRLQRRRELQQSVLGEGERHRLEGLPAGQNPDGFEVTLRELPRRKVAYIRVLSPYSGDGVPRAAERLWTWADVRGLSQGQWLGYQWEDPDIVPLDQCRYDVGLEVPDGVGADGEVGVLEFSPMTVAELPVAGPIDLEQRAIDWLYLTWLPRSGYAPAHAPTFEAWDGRPFAHGMAHFELRLQLPVER